MDLHPSAYAEVARQLRHFADSLRWNAEGLLTNPTDPPAVSFRSTIDLSSGEATSEELSALLTALVCASGELLGELTAATGEPILEIIDRICTYEPEEP